MPRCSGPQDLTPTAHLRTLEAADAAFFKQHGFLIKKRLLDPAKTAAALGRVWDALEGVQAADDLAGVPEARRHSATPGISRTEPASWIDASVNHDGKHGGGLRSLGHLDWLLDLVPNDIHVRGIATAMLGPLRRSRRVRGVYAIFPSSEKLGRPLVNTLAPHNDGGVSQLNAMAYLSDVGKRSGGTTFWPGKTAPLLRGG